MEILIGVLFLCGLVGLYAFSSAMYERVFKRKARYGCDGGCSGCKQRGSCGEAEKGGH